MIRTPRPQCRTVVLLLLFVLLAPAAASALALQETTLANGLRIVYGTNRASGLVASAVFVGAGAARETAGMNGAAHFLEHLLFNGTEKRTQEELYRDTDLLGAYSNATTRRDHVVYLMVVGGEDLDAALEIQADMLFNSTLPPDKFEKERGIILEEMARDRTHPERKVEEELAGLLSRGAALPILGTVESIESLPRDDVLAYYRRYYVPSNMTMLVLGDFEANELLAAVERHFGAATGEPPPALPQKTAPAGMFSKKLAVDQVHLRIRLPGPAPADSAFAALLVLADLLNGETGRLDAALRREPALDADDVGASVRIEAGQSFLEIQAAVAPTVDHTAVAGRLLGAVAALAATPVPAAELEPVRTRREVGAALAAEQIHYVAFTQADLILNAPRRYVAAAESVLAAVGPAALARCAAELMTREGAALAVVGPGLAERAEVRDPRRLAVAPPAPDPAAGSSAPSEAPPAPARPPRVATEQPPRTVVLDSGLTLILSANPDSDVFAVHLAARGRSYCEPPGQSGIADLLHRTLLLGAGSWSRSELGREIDRAGLQIKVTDLPGIPYDDYQTTQEFSFVRMETADRFYQEALAVLGAMVFAPAIDDDTLAEARKEASALAERRARSAYEQSQVLLRQAFYPDSRAAAPPLGTAADLAAITVADLRAFHAAYFAPGNLVVAVVTRLEPEAVLAAARTLLGPPGAGGGPCARGADMRPAPTAAPARAEVELGGEQAWIRVGSVFDCAPADVPALEVAGLLLSDRVAFELRERQGLAYAIGAAFGHRGDRGWIAAGMGTRPENLARAESGLVAAVRALGASDIQDAEVTKVVKSHLGRLRMRQVTRINQAMNLCLEHLAAGEGPAMTALAKVTAADVRRVAATYWQSAPFVTVVAR